MTETTAKGQGPRERGAKSEATPAEPQHFHPAYFYPSGAGRDFFLVQLTCECSRGITWLINGSRCLVKSCKSPFLGTTNEDENRRLRLSDARRKSTSHND